MLRIVVQSCDFGAATSVGGPVTTSIKTFDIQSEDLEAFLKEKPEWVYRHVVGVEVLDK